MGLKNVTLQGRLVRDPESRQSNSGTDICNFTVAVDSNKAARGEDKPKASFFRVTAFGKRGLTCQQYLGKGDEVSVVGDIELDVFTSQEGKTHANMQVIASEVHFGRKARSNSGQGQQQQGSQQKQPQQSDGYGDNIY